MTNRFLIRHKSNYFYDRKVKLSPQYIRLKPAESNHIHINHYVMDIYPSNHVIHWVRDSLDNNIAQVSILEQTNQFSVEIEFLACIKKYNPFDFILDNEAVKFPFNYSNELWHTLQIYLDQKESHSEFSRWIESIDHLNITTIEFIVTVNKLINQHIQYNHREEQGVQPVLDTLKKKTGSCRDMAWLLIQTLRHFNVAARFVSGYHINSGNKHFSTSKFNLHAWVEAYLPGAGWIGLDPTTGLMINNEYIPLCHASSYIQTAPISGSIESCHVSTEFIIDVDVIESDATTKNLSTTDTISMDEYGLLVDKKMLHLNLPMTMGSEPTFTSSVSTDSPEWNTQPLGDEKLKYAEILFQRLKNTLTTHSIRYYSLGKWYPCEQLPRWSLNCYWLNDEIPIWRNHELISQEKMRAKTCSLLDAERLMKQLVNTLSISEEYIHSIYEDASVKLCKKFEFGNIHKNKFIAEINRLRPNLLGFALPLKFNNASQPEGATWDNDKEIYLNDINLPVGFRLPIDEANQLHCNTLCVSLHDNQLFVFMPKLHSLEVFLHLLNVIENAAHICSLPVVLGGHEPPFDSKLQYFKISPDPGVIEINMPVSTTWHELVMRYKTLYEEVQALGLTAEKYLPTGKPAGSGGGHHITIGGLSPEQSPVLRNPKLLRSITTYWQHHPALSYLFSGLFIGYTSQAPRVDESRPDNLKELELEFQQLDRLTTHGMKSSYNEKAKTDNVFKSFKYLFTDITGNPHRAEICIDKLFLQHDRSQLQGILEFRAFETPPTFKMCSLQFLLIRSLICYLWENPYCKPFIHWGNQLHDKFMLPHYIWSDFNNIISNLNEKGYKVNPAWFESFYEHRFPLIGETHFENIHLELRSALEPWNVISDEILSQNSSRTVDASLERIQVKISGISPHKHSVICNGIILPLHSTERLDEYVGGIRFKAANLPISLHPFIFAHKKIEIDVIDTITKQSLGGCSYTNIHESSTKPLVNQHQAFLRRNQRFSKNPIKYNVKYNKPASNEEDTLTLDLCTQKINYAILADD